VSQHNSSISSSKLVSTLSYRALLAIGAWAFVCLVAIDLFFNIVFAYPSDPKVTDPSRLRLYFEYGRSAEGALSRMTRSDRSETAPITLVGWYNPLAPTYWLPDSTRSSSEPEQGGPTVTIYGPSHAMRLAAALARVTKRFSVRSVGAPGATSNWSYGAYVRDRGGGKSAAVVLTFNSNNLAMITSFSPAFWSPDYPMPYTGDRFYLEHGQLKTMHAPYSSFEQYQQTFFSPQQWSQAVDFFARNDPFYNPILFRASILDHSSLIRLMHRAYAQNRQRAALDAVLNKTGFHPDSEAIKVARAIIHEFAGRARADGMLPIVYLVNNLGYSDNLFRALKPALDADNVPFLSSHTIVPPNDPSGYLPDSHFTDENDDRLAAALAGIIENVRCCAQTN
jgi:hypothetical protein